MIKSPQKSPHNPIIKSPSKSKFIETHRVWCLSLRLNAYYSYETFFWRTDPHGAPAAYRVGSFCNLQTFVCRLGALNAPHSTHRNTLLCGINRIVSVRTHHLRHSCAESNINGSRVSQVRVLWVRSGPIAHQCLLL